LNDKKAKQLILKESYIMKNIVEFHKLLILRKKDD